MTKPMQTGRARFNDTPSDSLPSAAGAPDSDLAPGEVVIAHFPVAIYRLIKDMTGVRLVRCDMSNTADAAPQSASDIQARNDRFWNGRK